MKANDQAQERRAMKATVVWGESDDGACSICGSAFYFKLGESDYGACWTHEIFWPVGTNIRGRSFDYYRFTSLNDMRHLALELHGFEMVGAEAEEGRLAGKEAWFDAAIALKRIAEMFERYFEEARKRKSALTREQLESMTINEILPDEISLAIWRETRN
jgi:hypothetical protein